jgi:uncharacterized damage-inducible protein DinB
MAFMIEPWLSGAHADSHPAVAALLYSFEMARQDLAVATEGLTTEQLWARPHGVAAVGFHLRHIAGSTDRLFTYSEAKPLSEEQLARLGAEEQPGAGRDLLLAEIDGVFESVAARARRIDPAILCETRTIGRKQLPTTLLGLLVHIAEHTQRHTGQAVTTARFVKP